MSPTMSNVFDPVCINCLGNQTVMSCTTQSLLVCSNFHAAFDDYFYGAGANSGGFSTPLFNMAACIKNNELHNCPFHYWPIDDTQPFCVQIEGNYFPGPRCPFRDIHCALVRVLFIYRFSAKNNELSRNHFNKRAETLWNYKCPYKAFLVFTFTGLYLEN